MFNFTLDDAYVRVEIVLTNDEVRMVDNKVLPFTGYFIQHQILEEVSSTMLVSMETVSNQIKFVDTVELFKFLCIYNQPGSMA